MQKEIYSVETADYSWNDDLFNGTLEECLEYCTRCGIVLDGIEARIARILIDSEGSFLECLEIITQHRKVEDMGNALTLEKRYKKAYISSLSADLKRLILRNIMQNLNALDLSAQERTEALRNAYNSRVCDLTDTINIIFI